MTKANSFGARTPSCRSLTPRERPPTEARPNPRERLAPAPGSHFSAANVDGRSKAGGSAALRRRSSDQCSHGAPEGGGGHLGLSGGPTGEHRGRAHRRTQPTASRKI